HPHPLRIHRRREPMSATLTIVASFLLPMLPLAPAAADQDLYVHAAHMLDVASGRTSGDVVVHVRGKQIVEIGNGARAPGGAQPVDLAGLTRLPGLLDIHRHLRFSLDGGFVHRALHESAADAALRRARNARVTLRAGFTTVRNLGSDDFVDVALMRA